MWMCADPYCPNEQKVEDLEKDLARLEEIIRKQNEKIEYFRNLLIEYKKQINSLNF